MLAPAGRAAEPVNGQVRIARETGFSRMVFHFDEEVPAKVTMDGMIMVIKFAKPVNVDVDKLNTLAPETISAARSDPDGSAVTYAGVSSRAAISVSVQTWSATPAAMAGVVG